MRVQSKHPIAISKYTHHAVGALGVSVVVVSVLLGQGFDPQYFDAFWLQVRLGGYGQLQHS